MSSLTSASTLNDWLAWLEQLHPTTIELGLDRVRQVYERLQPDFTNTTIVIVGGTNGKGSTVTMLSSVLRQAGFRVGNYTSPHLLHYNERVNLDGKSVSDEALTEAFARVEACRAGVSLTYFEYGTLAALELFARNAPDFLILEVGLGGRLDAVNIVDPALSILTNVALDHMDWLGDTREAIGYEKAGIFRSGKPAIFAESDMPDSVGLQAERIHARLLRKDQAYHWTETGSTWQWEGAGADGQPRLETGLPRNGFPLDNAAAVIQALSLLVPELPRTALDAGLAGAVLAGRFQALNYQGCRVILDVAHNPHAAANLAHNIRTLLPVTGKVLLVIGMLGDKDSAGVVKLLAPLADQWFIASLKGERGASSEIIYNHARTSGHQAISCFDDVKTAFLAACKQAEAEDSVIVTGSFFTVAAVLELI